MWKMDENDVLPHAIFALCSMPMASRETVPSKALIYVLYVLCIHVYFYIKKCVLMVEINIDSVMISI